jgi:serpin B
MADVLESDKPRQSPLSFEAARVPELVAGNTSFALDLYHVLMEDTEQNLLFSPYSLSVALAMTYAGARGETERQMAEALRLPAQDQVHPAFNALDQALAARGAQESVALAFANALWPQRGYPFLDAFLDLLAENYGAGLKALDFGQAEAARQQINGWASDETEERVQELLPEGAVDGETVLVLTNAVYFDAAWLNPFPEEATYKGGFKLLEGRQVGVPMMSQTTNLSYTQFDGVQAVELPYAGQELSMVVLVPDAGTFESYASSLTADGVNAVLAALQPASVRLDLPKFSYDSGFALKQALTKLGITDAFTMEADFSGMDGAQELYVDDVYHKAFIAVDEAGTEAAAASAVVMSRKGISRPQELIVNRPFIYLIRDIETEAILFLGHVLDPS